jgi:hypothetical protein
MIGGLNKMCRTGNGGVENSITKQIIDGNYEPDDYLLIDHNGEIMAVSGNSEFDDLDDDACAELLLHTYTIVKVVAQWIVEHEEVEA